MKSRLLKIKLLLGLVVSSLFLSTPVFPQGGWLDEIMGAIAYILITVAAFGRVWSSAYIVGKKDNMLVMKGPYSVTRNPLYFFSFIGFLGIGLATESIVISLIMMLIFFGTHWPTILEEEEKLKILFGEKYRSYLDRVPRFLPKIARVGHPKALNVNSRIFTKSVVDNAILAMSFGLIQLCEWLHAKYCLPTLFKIL
jgi:protein-S-isoprenylcysteine O-methyltransferase Ste14